MLATSSSCVTHVYLEKLGGFERPRRDRLRVLHMQTRPKASAQSLVSIPAHFRSTRPISDASAHLLSLGRGKTGEDKSSSLGNCNSWECPVVSAPKVRVHGRLTSEVVSNSIGDGDEHSAPRTYQ